MKLLSHFSGISNSYILGPKEGGEAILVDPGRFDVFLLNLIESNSFNITTVLITHINRRHIRGLKTLKKVYDARLISGNEEVGGFESEFAEPGSKIEASGISIKTLDLEERMTDSRVFRIGNLLFTGNTLSAGRMEDFFSPKKRARLIAGIQKKILTIAEELLILPSYGPPSTISAELRWNPDFHPRRPYLRR